MEFLRKQVKNMIIEVLNLEDVSPGDIDDDGPLFGEGLGLDSIDALELVVEIEKRFSVRIENKDVAKDALASVSAISEFISSRRDQA